MIVRIVIAAVAFVLALIAARNALASTRVMTRREDEPEDVVAFVTPIRGRVSQTEPIGS